MKKNNKKKCCTVSKWPPNADSYFASFRFQPKFGGKNPLSKGIFQ